MLRFFRINDPYRLIGVILILIILRLPFWLSDIGMTIPQLTWILVAKRLSQGAIMYSEVWETLSPLSAGFHWIIFSIFGDSFIAGQVLSVMIIFIQAVIFNNILINRGALNENTYIPATIYVVLASLFFDFYTLSPVMLANTFVLLAIDNVFGQIEIRAKRDEKLLMTGVYMGAATLFHFPYFVFGVIILFVFILFTATVRRRYVLYLFGWVLPMILTALYYFYHDSFALFWRNNVASWFMIDTQIFISNQQMLLMNAYVIFFLFLSFFAIFSRGRLTNYQSRLIQAVLFIMLLSGTILLVEVDRSPYLFLVFLFPTSFFLSHYFTMIKKGLFAELFFLVFILGAGLLNFKSIKDSANDGLFKMDKYFVQNVEGSKELEGMRISWLGDNKAIYYNAFPATPFLNWRLSSEVWVESRKFNNLIIIGRSLETDKPDIIIDPMDLAPKFFQQAPNLSRKYRKEDQKYYRISNN